MGDTGLEPFDASTCFAKEFHHLPGRCAAESDAKGARRASQQTEIQSWLDACPVQLPGDIREQLRAIVRCRLRAMDMPVEGLVDVEDAVVPW